MNAEQRRFAIVVGDGEVRGVLMAPRQKTGDAPLPAVLICWEFAFGSGETATLMDALPPALASAGIACALFEPRCADPRLEGAGEYSANDAVADARAALQWLAQQPAVDRGRVGVLGLDFGAIAASCLAGDAGLINRLCLLAPTTTEEVVARIGQANGAVAQLLDSDTTPPGMIETLPLLSPVSDAAAIDRPVLILHGAADRVVSPERSLRYLDAIELAGHDVAHLLIPRADHGFSEPEARSLCIDLILSFFKAMEPRAVVEESP